MSLRSGRQHFGLDANQLPLLPTVLTVRTEDYALSRRLFLYTSSSPKAVWAIEFADFAESAEGQAVVEKIGFVSMTPNAEPSDSVCNGCPPDYAAVTKGAHRLSLNFRFESGNMLLETRAQKDVERLIAMLSDPGKRGREVLLFGFADSTGDPMVNLELSRQRAEAVAKTIRLRGVTPTVVKGFGDKMPVAPNDTEANRDRNRRVEIWLR